MPIWASSQLGQCTDWTSKIVCDTVGVESLLV